MDVRRRPPLPPRAAGVQPSLKTHRKNHHPKASDALPLPLYLKNGLFFTLFFTVAYFLLLRWREKIRTSTPLHVVTLSELAALFSLFASVIYLLGFFGIDFVHNNDVVRRNVVKRHIVVPRIHKQFHDTITDDNSSNINDFPPRPRVFAAAYSRVVVTPQEDEEIINSVVSGATPSYTLESKLGDCRRAAAIRQEALQRMTCRSLEGLPLDGFDYDSILGQCCEMPIGYVQIPVGVAGPLLLNGEEHTVPMATTEGCLHYTRNRLTGQTYLMSLKKCLINHNYTTI